MEGFVFAEEPDDENRSLADGTWNVLIVDDEQDVHESTLLALGREKLCGRPLHFDHAYSAQEAKNLLSKNKSYAVILLDVVMENDQAGLQLVRFIREELRLSDTRIILRTGQPGYAPELESIAKYEINDYKTKSDLTRNKLFTALTASIRSYEQIRALQMSKQGLERIIRASKELLYLRGFQEFASGVITQLSALFNLPAEGLVCVKGYRFNNDDRDGLHVIAGAGKYRDFILKPVSEIQAKEVVGCIKNAALQRQHVFNHSDTCLYFATPDHAEMIVYLAAHLHPEHEDLQLLELFSTNIAACVDNVSLLEQRHEYAYRDQLLGIPNRLSFLQTIEDHLQKQTPELQIVLIDLDQFSALNDTIGTENGDTLLKQIATRLQNSHRDQLVARISGDTFGLLGPLNVISCESVMACFEDPFEVEGAVHSLSATQGQVVLAGQKAAKEVLAQASTALKRAKQTLRGSFQSFQQNMLKETESHVNLLQNLRKAFAQENLFMVYQPKINLATGELRGFEALMRWRNLEGEFVAPDDFIPIAEASGLIVPLGEWAMRRSLVQIKQLRDLTQLDLKVAVNVSMVQFAHPKFMKMLREAFEFAEADPQWLEIEITESFAMHDFETVKNLIREIRELGATVSIDDFGTGFSSLSYLEKLEVHSLKIDKTFIDRIDDDNADTRIPETILNLGKALGLEVVAEGVETPTQVAWLKEKGCDVAQGYFFAKPLFIEQIETWLAKHLEEQQTRGQSHE